MTENDKKVGRPAVRANARKARDTLKALTTAKLDQRSKAARDVRAFKGRLKVQVGGSFTASQEVYAELAAQRWLEHRRLAAIINDSKTLLRNGEVSPIVTERERAAEGCARYTALVVAENPKDDVRALLDSIRERPVQTPPTRFPVSEPPRASTGVVQTGNGQSDVVSDQKQTPAPCETGVCAPPIPSTEPIELWRASWPYSFPPEPRMTYRECSVCRKVLDGAWASSGGKVFCIGCDPD